MRASHLRHFVLAVAAVGLPVAVVAAADRPAAPAEPTERTELFAAIENEQLTVTVAATSFARLTLSVRNRTDQTLEVAIPEVFSAIPRMEAPRRSNRQLSRPRTGSNNSRGNQPYQPYGPPGQLGTQTAQAQLPQGLGGSLAYTLDQDEITERPRRDAEPAGEPDGPPLAAGQGQVGHWTLQPHERKVFRLPCFCLEFGKPDPTRHVTYELRPLERLNDRPAVRELLKRFGEEEMDQRIAQLTVWHVANGVPWQRLARVRLPRAARLGRAMFSPKELLAARRLAESLPSYQSPDSMHFGSGS